MESWDELRDVAAELRAPDQPPLRRRQAVVVGRDVNPEGIDLGTVTITLEDVEIPGVPFLASYIPAAGDVVWMLQYGPEVFIVGRLAAPGEQPPGGGTTEHPSLGAHDLMGLQTDGEAAAHAAGANHPGLTVLAAGTPSVRALGTGATDAAAGNDARLTVLGAGNPSIRALGTGATDAAAGNDARLSNARTPTAHATTHATGGTDALTPANIGAAAATHPHDAKADLVGGKVPATQLGGLGADATKFLRGDLTWQTVETASSAWSFIQAAGDLVVGTGAGTVTRLARGTARQFLRVDAAGTAIEWAAADHGGLTNLTLDHHTQYLTPGRHNDTIQTGSHRLPSHAFTQAAAGTDYPVGHTMFNGDVATSGWPASGLVINHKWDNNRFVQFFVPFDGSYFRYRTWHATNLWSAWKDLDDHAAMRNLTAADQHSIGAITGLTAALADKIDKTGGVFSGPVLLPNGSPAVPAIAFATDDDTGFYTDTTQGTLVLSLDASGYYYWTKSHFRPVSTYHGLLDLGANTIRWRHLFLTGDVSATTMRDVAATNTTAQSFTNTTWPGAALGANVNFVAPLSGIVTIWISLWQRSDGANNVYVAPRITNGFGTTGTVHVEATDNNACRIQNVNTLTQSCVVVRFAVTAGNEYNAEVRGRVTAGTGFCDAIRLLIHNSL